MRIDFSKMELPPKKEPQRIARLGPPSQLSHSKLCVIVLPCPP